MYNFHYNFMIRKFNTRLLFTDTDSLCYERYEKNTYKKMYKYKEYEKRLIWWKINFKICRSKV